MKSWKLFPKDSSVAKYIDCYWFLEKNQEDISFERPKLNPDPAAHLIVANTQQKQNKTGIFIKRTKIETL